MSLRKNIKDLRKKAVKSVGKVAKRAAKHVVKRAAKRAPKAAMRARAASKAARKAALKGAMAVGKVAFKAAKQGAKAVVVTAAETAGKGAKEAGKAAARTAAKVAMAGAKQVARTALTAAAQGAKDVVRTVKEAKPVVPRQVVTVKDPKDKSFEKGPGFHRQVWFRPEGVDEPGLHFVGYEIADNDVNFNQYLHYDQLYTIRHGQNSRFFRNLLKGKLVGTRCPKCGAAWVPPRTTCWNLDCDLQETQWVDFPLRAKVHTWTIAGWSGRSSLKNLPFVLVYAKIEGSTVAIANYLKGIDPWDVEFDMPLEVVFVPEDQRVGGVNDFYFVPAKGWKPGPMNPEKERIKKLVMPVYEWVKTLK